MPDARTLILPHVNGVRPAGEDRWMACCPAHDDRNASLSIRQTPERVLVHCFAGCSYEAILAALGLESQDLQPPHPSRPSSRRSPVAPATYREAEIYKLLVEQKRRQGQALTADEVRKDAAAKQLLDAEPASREEIRNAHILVMLHDILGTDHLDPAKKMEVQLGVRTARQVIRRYERNR